MVGFTDLTAGASHKAGEDRFSLNSGTRQFDERRNSSLILYTFYLKQTGDSYANSRLYRH